MAKQKIYFRNSAVRLRFSDAEGCTLPLADMDWSAALYTPSADAHLTIGHSTDGGFYGCTPLPGSDCEILVDFSAGTILPGALKARFTTADGETVKLDLGVDLTALPSHTVGAAEVAATLPVVMGKVDEVFDSQINDVFAPVLDEIAAQVEGILGGTVVLPPSASGGGGTAPASAAPSVPLFREGIIPWDAEPKYVYRNLGWVKLGKLAKKLEREPTPAEVCERINENQLGLINKNGHLMFSQYRAQVGISEPYLRRNPDTGMIEGYSGPVAMPPQPADAPAGKIYEAPGAGLTEVVTFLLGEGQWERRGVWGVYSPVHGHCRWQVQIKANYRKGKGTKERTLRWVNATPKRNKLVRFNNTHCCGIFRIRTVNRSFKYQGRWQVYTYCPGGLASM